MLELENKTFEQKLPDLLRTDNVKFVLVKEDCIAGIFSAIDGALSYGYEKFNKQPFFVRKISPAQQPLTF